MDKTVISKQTFISVGLTIVIVGATFFIGTTVAKFQKTDEELNRRVTTVENNYVPRAEYAATLQSINSSIKRIEDSVINK